MPPTTEQVTRPQDAIEGECDGLAIDDQQAISILNHLGDTPSPETNRGREQSEDGQDA